MNDTIIIAAPAGEYLSNEDEAINSRNRHEAQFQRVVEDLESVHDIFELKVSRRHKNYDFYAGRQWSPEEIVAHHRQKREAFVFNEIKPKIEHLCGLQTQTRMDAMLLPREQGDSDRVETLNFMLKWAEQTNGLEYVESDIYKEATIGGVGASVVRWEQRDLIYGYPKVEKVPINEMYWDLNAKKPTMEDARWMSRVAYMTKMDALEAYPDQKDAIDAANEVSVTGNGTRLYNVQNDHQEEVLKNRYNVSETQGRRVIRVIEYYEKVKAYKFVVVDEVSGDIKDFDDKKAAMGFYQGKVDQYKKDNTDLVNPDGSPRVVCLCTSVNVIYQSVVIGDLCVIHRLTSLNDFPFVLCFAYFNEGDYWGYVDDLIPPQILVNRGFSQWDYILGASAKNPTTVMESLLKRGMTVEDIRREYSKTTPIFSVMSHEAIKQHPSPVVNPQIFDSISFGINRMNDYAGGRNTLGLQESAAESGRAVIARAEQGGLARLPLFDRLRLWRKGVTERLVWWIQNYVPPNQLLRVIGDSGDAEFMDLDVNVLDTLKEIKIDIVIDEVAKSETMKERNFQVMKDLFSVLPNVPPEIVVPTMLEYSSLPERKKKELKKMLEFHKEYVQKKAEMAKQEKMVTEVTDSIKKKELKNRLTRDDELKEAEDQLKKHEKNVQKKQQELEKAEKDAQEKELSLNNQQANGKINAGQEMVQRGAQSIINNTN